MSKPSQGQSRIDKAEEALYRDVPLAMEFQALAQFLAQEVKQVPTEAQPAAVVATDLAIGAIAVSVEALVMSLPSLPASDSRLAVKERSRAVKNLLKHTCNPAAFRSAWEFVTSVQGVYDPATGLVPVVPHEVASSVIADQAAKLILQFTKELTE